MAEAPATTSLELALLSNRFEGIARAMMNTLLRTARSAILNTARDFSCCILTAGDEILAMAESLPIHVMIGPDMMAKAVMHRHPQLRRGDAFLHNSPYEGNSHAADHCMIAPVIDDAGVLRFFVLAKAHQADCGNSRPTTYMGHARDVYEEGALIFPAVKVQQDYRDVEDIIYWSKEQLGTRGVVSVTHLAIARLTDSAPAMFAVASRQIYGAHYFDASLGLTVLLRDNASSSPASYLVYVNRSRLDALGGMLGGLKGAVVRSRSRSAMANSLIEARDRVERRFRAEPPRPGE